MFQLVGRNAGGSATAGNPGDASAFKLSGEELVSCAKEEKAQSGIRRDRNLLMDIMYWLHALTALAPLAASRTQSLQPSVAAAAIGGLVRGV